MKTSELIAVLSNNVEAVNKDQLKKTIGTAVVAGTALGIGAMLRFFGVRTHLETTHAWLVVTTKLVFTVGVAIPASMYLLRVARPGGEHKTSVALVALPFAGIALLGCVSLMLAPLPHWHSMMLGGHWLECLVSIPMIAIVPFLIVILALRQTAPTDLTRAGAFAGLIAGSVAAIGYTLHCVDDSLPFIALWYGGAMAFCTAVGAYLGPKLLRW